MGKISVIIHRFSRLSILFKTQICCPIAAPGPLTLKNNLPYYIEGGNNTNVQCLNFNARPEYKLNREIWMNSAGEVIGNGRRLNLSATRDNAGIYTCTVPDVPLILPVMFEVVIYSK